MELETGVERESENQKYGDNIETLFDYRFTQTGMCCLVASAQ